MRRIETSIGISAPPERVWAILVDFESWTSWNTVIHMISAEARVGAHIHFRPNIENAPERGFPARIVRCETNVELAWFGAPLRVPALGNGEHWFHLAPNASGTLFRHGEDFRGLLIPLMPKAFFQVITEGYDAFNQALKTRAETA